MEAVIERDRRRLKVNVWLFDRLAGTGTSPGDVMAYRYGEDPIIVSGAEEKPAPTLTLSFEEFEALVQAGADVLPPSAALASHLEDAKMVRDRLLTIVEAS